MGRYIWLSPLGHKMLERWDAFTEHFPCEEHVRAAAFQILSQFYEQSHRRYHTLEHVGDCLDRLAEVPLGLLEQPEVVQMALWWHDVIFNPHSNKNEFESAQLAKQFCLMMNCNESASEWVAVHIEQTTHYGAPQHPDTKFLCDIDLASLGYDWETFSENSQMLREEYGFFTEHDYRTKTIEAMEGFLKKPSIYLTEFFRERYEIQARANIMRYVEDLRGCVR